MTFDPSSDKLCVNLTVKSDSGQEVEEVFGVAIQSTAERTQLSPERATVFINDTTPGRAECYPTLLKMGRYYNTTMRHYWDMLVK